MTNNNEKKIGKKGIIVALLGTVVLIGGCVWAFARGSEVDGEAVSEAVAELVDNAEGSYTEI